MKTKNKKIFVGLILIIIMLFTIQMPTLATTTAEDDDIVSWSDDSYQEDGWGYETDDGWSYQGDGKYYYEDDNSYAYVDLYGLFAVLILVVIFIVFVIVIAILSKKGVLKNSMENNEEYVRHDEERGYATNTSEMSENEVQNKISKIDPEFSREEFLSWAKDLFIKLQYAWSDKDLDTIRCFETPQLFEHHKSQIQRYTENNQVDKIERLSINWAKLFSFIQEGSRDVLSVLINSKMIDYLVDEKTGKVLNGSQTELRTNTYKLTFVRTAGVKTKPGTTSVNTTNCPNCGAPVEITTAGKCQYCGSVITSGNFGWVLSNLEPYKAVSGETDYGENGGGFGVGFVSGAVAGGLLNAALRGMFAPPPPHFGGPGPRGGFGGPGGPRGGFGGPGGGPRGGPPGGRR